MSINWLNYTGPEAQVSKQNIYNLLDEDYSDDWKTTVSHVSTTMTKQLDFSEQDIHKTVERYDISENYAARRTAIKMADQLDKKDTAEIYLEAKQNNNREMEKVLSPVLRKHDLQTGETLKELLETQ